MREQPLYSVGTWDVNEQAYTPQAGLSVPSINVPLPTLRQACRELRRQHGYGCYRVRDAEGDHHGDPDVLIERTDGLAEAEVLKQWGRAQ